MFNDLVHYHIGPPFIILIFTLLTPAFPLLGAPSGHSLEWEWFGNSFSWSFVFVSLLWSATSLWVPSKIYRGPTTAFGYTPVYSANGVQYFIVSNIVYVILLCLKPDLPNQIFNNYQQILMSFNIFGLVFCVYLYIQGKYWPQVIENTESYPLPYEFYRGMETHPRVLGIDVKQWIICRFSMMFWQIFNIAFAIVGWQAYGFNFVTFVSVLLQSVYLMKFFWWETGYFNTIDIIHDRGGYYLCWGCLVLVPALFPFSLYYLSYREPMVGNIGAFGILIFGLVSVALNYRSDWEKEYFRHHKGKCNIWGKPAKFIRAKYQTNKGTKESLLLTSGFWGIARHTNYVFETLVAISWSLPAYGYGVIPYTYAIFIFVLAIHRVFRDEEKCIKKYGDSYREYCRAVPYRFIPYVF